MEEEKRCEPCRLMLRGIVGEEHVGKKFVPVTMVRRNVHAEHAGQCAVEMFAQPVRLWVVSCGGDTIRAHETEGFPDELANEGLSITDDGFGRPVT